MYHLKPEPNQQLTCTKLAEFDWKEGYGDPTFKLMADFEWISSLP